ncbi:MULTISPECIES: DHA2 family efflux MFS transporter permease subunit [unclassified Rhizobium]|jgi:DHA2 family multidrug resistance protein|uniref:DHA2 family efflux MFS transporter permease subunit n=1 Tax=unclassified Rhizobium TaxID=2613769 RepID=UPI000A5976B1|nr:MULTISPECIES: DHA2 family efflux MFS transporter permease subunit [unclassified Rhizobium]MBN8953578.1 DHA2 family efflux MFS transporter permease subunit [Rhizobium tropici]RKD67758.1 EmrB/QacA subfamily drug resistance transporter [Rhizobium sp. WW_1]
MMSDETGHNSSQAALAGGVGQFSMTNPAQTNMVLIGLGLATWMEFYTYDAVNLVLPDMAGSFGISQDEASWFLTTYSSALLLGVPVSIWMAGYVGHLRYILGSAIIFVIASLGCAVATNQETMLLWRIILGFSGAGLTMWWRASVYMLVPKQSRSRSLMKISVMLYLATSAGLLFSGFVTDNFSWRLIFLPNVIFVIAAIILLRQYFPQIPRSLDRRARGIDGPGIVLLATALICGQTVLSRGEIDDWFGSTRIQVLSLICVASLASFVAWQLNERNDARLLRLELIRDRHLLAAIFLGVFAGIILSGSLYALPEFLRNVNPQMLSATDTGRLMAVYALTAALIRPFVTSAIGKYGQRKILAFALLMLIASMLMMARLITTETPYTYFALPLVLYAFCLAPLLSSIAGGTVARLPQEAQLDAVSIYMTFRQFGASLGVTLVTIIIDRREELHSGRLFEHLNATSAVMSQWITTAADSMMQRGGVTSEQAHDMALKLLAETSTRQAATLAYADAFLFMAAIGIISLCFIPLMSPTPVVKK